MPFRCSITPCTRLATALFIALVATGCQAQDRAHAQARDLPARLAALKAATLKHMVFVPGGTFQMGDFGPIHNAEKLPYSSATDDDVLHKVTLDGFSIGAYKVTYADFDVFTDSTGKPRVAQGKLATKYRNLPGIPAGVNWYDAQAYCQWLGKQLNLPMDLPTEAQWEYAARSGGKMIVYATDNGKIDDGRNVPSYEQYQAYTDAHDGSLLLPVGKYPANKLGMYDMISNGFEWVHDWYAPTYEGASSKNPSGPESGTEKAKRGSDNEGGDTLQLTSMTFSRSRQSPYPTAKKSKFSFLNTDNPNFNDAFRCVIKKSAQLE